MKITVKITNYTPKPAKKTKSAIMKKYMAITVNEKYAKKYGLQREFRENGII